MYRWLRLALLTGCVALSATGAHAAGAALICETAPGVRMLQRVDGFPTKAEAGAAVRARCRAAALTSQARAARAEQPRLPQASNHPTLPPAGPLPERACRRYPNLC